MSNQHQMPRRPLQQMPRQWWALPAAFVATLLALPVNAGITIPDDPLTTGVRVAPNVMFILDDSGSMANDYMPDSVPPTTTPNVARRAYPRNTLSYNPATTYNTWTKADGTKMTGGTSYTAAYGSFNLVGGTTINLGDSGSCQTFNQNDGSSSTNTPSSDETSSGTSVCGGMQTFYVPKDTTQTAESYLGNGQNYYLYQILAGGSDIKRGVWGDIVIPHDSGVDGNYPDSGTAGSTLLNNYTHTVVAGRRLEIQIDNRTTGGGTRSLNYWIYNPSNTQIRSGVITKGNSVTETIDPAVAGQYRIALQRANTTDISFRIYADSYGAGNRCIGETGNDGDKGWIDCISALPSSRDLPNELINYATWFSYARTRMKAAKGGASLAFAGMDSRVRVGFRTIWGRAASKFDIPVTDGNDGRFVNNPDDPAVTGDQSTTSRTQWYNKLFGVIGYNGTPLHGALQAAGEYYKTTGTLVNGKDTGPYGPEAGTNQFTCRQNYSILTTDGYWNNDSNFTSGIGNADNTAGPSIGKPPSSSYNYVAAAPFRDSYGSYSWDSGNSSVDATLADVAMYYWNRDLRTETFMGNTTTPTGNNVPTSDDDPAFWQHMVTFGISIGLSGTVDQSSVSEVKANGGASVNGVGGWPQAKADTATAIDDLLHAAVNGHGTFIAATNPIAFAAGLKAALSTINKRTSSYSNVATNSASLRSGAMVFNASYVSGLWSGDVKGYSISAAGGVAATATWSANFPAWSTRKIYTAGGTFPTSTQITSLDRSTVGLADYQVTGLENANYIRGKRDLEGSDLGDLRERSTVLGDIVGSSPEYVEDTNTLYVGSNDGMLHAFNAANGTELFAYVPGILSMAELGKISRGDYATQHKFFVDGPLVASPRSLTSGQNILVGALGKGGKGIFALDVSNPGTISASPMLWEKTSASSGYGNLGLVLGKPVMGRVGGTPAVVISNGPNSASDKAVLIVANLATGAVIKEIDTGVGSSAAPNGLFAPTGILGADGNLLYVYAGDMQGNLWKFDLKTTVAADQKKLLFSAKVGGTGAVQPITAGVGVATDPKTFKRWVFFGTGRFLTTTDASDKTANAQSMYGIIDEDATVAYADLDHRSLTGSGTTRTAAAKAALSSGKKGWDIPLPGAGERIVQDAQVESNVLVTASLMPTGDGCDSGGTGYINAVDAFTGTSTGGAFFDLNGNGSTTDDTVTGSVNYGVGMPTLPIIFPGRIVVGGTGGSSGGGAGAPGGGQKLNNTWNRVSWREIRQD